MDKHPTQGLDLYRLRGVGPLENSLIDDLAEGEITRADFIRHASVLGLSASVVGAALAAFGGGGPAFAAPVARPAGGRLRLGAIPAPVGVIEPHLFVEAGQIVVGSIMGEFLTRATAKLTLVPELALSWKPNKNATVWTFKLRPNVKFANGSPFGADDVVATYERLVNAAKGSQALAVFKGVLSPGNIKKIDNLTVQFTLDAPNASFPYLTSNSTYNAIILPSSYKEGTFTDTPSPTTGGFRLTSFTPGVGATYERHTGWWGGTTPADGVDVRFYEDAAAVNAALLGGQIDLISQIAVASSRALFGNPNVQIFQTPGATHRAINLAVDMNPNLRDFRVRQAIALTLDRPNIVKKLFAGYAVVGNDSPFAPVYPTSAKLPQRRKDIARAKALMAAAGKSRGFKLKVTTYNREELPSLAVILKAAARQVGIDVAVDVQTGTKYYGGKYEGGRFGLGNTPWLNTEANITDWAHRPVPNIYLTASLMSGGIWNASHWKNKQFDKAAKAFFSAIALADQRKYARQMQLLMLHDTPVIYPYFYSFLAAGKKSIRGYTVDPTGINVSRLSL